MATYKNILNKMHLRVGGPSSVPVARRDGPSFGLVPCSLSIVSGPKAKPNECVLAEAVKSCMRRRVYLQIMTWYLESFLVEISFIIFNISFKLHFLSVFSFVKLLKSFPF